MKPDNVMLDLNSGDLEIFDYGLSKEAENNDAGEFLGSPGFIPLEVYLNQGTTAKSDIFSVSVIIALFWYADLPGQTAEEIANYQFHNIFKDDKIDLTDPEKNQILTTLKQMSKHERDDRYSAAEALSDFINIRETYVNRKIDEMGAVKSTPYRLENGLFVNNNKHHPKRIQHEELPPSHTCRF